jgi:hypothetical protein
MKINVVGRLCQTPGGMAFRRMEAAGAERLGRAGQRPSQPGVGESNALQWNTKAAPDGAPRTYERVY